MCGRCTRARASQQVVSDCGATLIVCPASILQQWQSEITKHTQPGALKVITYLGQHKTSLHSLKPQSVRSGRNVPVPDLGKGPRDGEKGRADRTGKYSGQGVVSAEDLAAADVVLTSYDVLKRDLHHQADPQQHSRTFRTRKRYEVLAPVHNHIYVVVFKLQRTLCLASILVCPTICLHCRAPSRCSCNYSQLATSALLSMSKHTS